MTGTSHPIGVGKPKAFGSALFIRRNGQGFLYTPIAGIITIIPGSTPSQLGGSICSHEQAKQLPGEYQDSINPNSKEKNWFLFDQALC